VLAQTAADPELRDVMLELKHVMLELKHVMPEQKHGAFSKVSALAHWL
jgi:hypothetical protein